jgi:subtilase family serine protease
MSIDLNVTGVSHMRTTLVSSSGRPSFGIPSALITGLIAAAIAVVMTLTSCATATAQEGAETAMAPRPLITQPVDESNLTTLTGNTYPLARAEFDLGTAPATLPMERMLLVLKRSPEQEAGLEKLLDDQQNKTSPNYHKWLEPEIFGQQFGPADEDMQTIASWLQSHGFRVGSTKGRTVLEFSGSASQVQEAFHTTIHKYLVNGGQYWGNASDPQIPSALTPAVAGVRSLNNFPRKPMNVSAGSGERDPKTGKIRPVKPLLTFPDGCVENNMVQGYCQNWVGPYDFATIYDVLPLWNVGIDGTGVMIAIVGETDIQMSDVQAFRSFFGLPVNEPVFMLNGTDPGVQGDEGEADIDVEWSGAVAKGATIDFVISASTETTFGTDLSAVYIVENNLAAVMSESYGQCELGLGTAGNQFYSTLWQQASAQGITVMISAGDAGSAACDNFDAPSPAPAQYGLQVSGYASTPYNVAVGGTDFNDFSNPGTYWTTSNNPTTQESALSYIPESTWNDSCTNALWGTLPQFSTDPETNCNNPNLPDVIIVAGSGGESKCTTPSGSTPSSCAGGYARPSWQTGSGSFSNDGKRDIPDVSLFASNGFVGSAYAVCQADNGGACPGSVAGYGGTSVSSPAFAGIMALVNQKMGGRQGNANYILYRLAAQQPTAFHDVTVGTNAVPCATGSPNCTTTTGGDSYGILSGYNAVVGYDMATGLGSVDANNLVTKWSAVALLASTTTLSSLTPTTITHGQAVTFTAAVTPKSGTGTPSGVISLEGGPSNSTGAIAGFNLSNGSVTGSTDMLPGGTYSVSASYPGDATYGPSDSAPVSVTVNKENSQPQVFLVTFNSNGGVISGNTTTAVYGSPYILRVNVDNAAGQLCAPAATSGATACPTGSVSLTNNGTTLDAGTFPLNSYGYSEDLAVQLPGGTDSVKAAYAGDNSFNASSATNAITITPAGSEMNPPSVGSAAVGAVFTANALVQSLSSGVAPTGTVTFLVNGTPVSGTTTYQPGNQVGPPAVASLSANFTSSTSPFTTVGNYSITASYSGDGNYTPVTSQGTGVTVQYPSPSVTFTPATQNVNVGVAATLTALVDTTNKTVYPTGTVYFVNSQNGTVLAGPMTCTNTKDSSGNDACQVSATFTVSAAVTVAAQYIGDANYPATTAGIAQIVVNDFAIGMDSSSVVTVPQGQSNTAQIDVSDLGAFNGTVGNFTCSGLPAEVTCSFLPAQVAGSGSTMMTVTTTPVGQLRRRASNETRPNVWMRGAMLPLLGVCVIGIPFLKRRRGFVTMLMMVFIATLMSCGGGSSQQVSNNPVPSITSVSPTQQAAGSQPLTLTISGSGFMGDSTVDYNGVSHPATFVNSSQGTITLTTSDLATLGSYPVIVSNPAPGGGASNSVSFGVVTGTPTGGFTVTVGASSGSLAHTTTFTLMIQ